ncbi:hypothetical protein ACJMK2_041239 [Sinanodonta woodiana]|uniref:Acid sphingomyelinase-like phosphodiesterase n=1 Tax=Sinanodonta woodiana TaxID=1069815 RepID=A0ABD3W3H1_SINWO
MMKDIVILTFCFCAFGRGLGVDGARGTTRFFWQVSDFHFDASYNSSHGDPTKMCHEGSVTNSTQLGIFGNYLCDAPWKLIVSAMQAMKDFYPDPDFILWTGDSIPHIKDTDINLEKVYINIANVTDELRKTFPNTTIYPVLGNHDSYPSNEMPYDISISDYYRHILTTSHWDSLLVDDCQKQFQKGGYFSISPHVGLRIIALNTNLYSTLNTLTDHLVDPADQFQWLDGQLDDARKSKENVFLVAHIPPGLFEKIPNFPWFHEDYNKRYLDLLQKHADIITAQFYGHEHTDSFRLLYDSNSTEKPIGCLLLSPSVTPWMSTLPGVGANNPSIRLFEYDLETGIIKRYQQFYLNLTAANIDGNATWLQEYDTKEDYALDSITPHDMQHLVDSFYNIKNNIFQRYLIFNSVSQETSPACNSSCFQQNICAITKLAVGEYESCIAGSKTTNNPSSTQNPDFTTKHHEHDNDFPKFLYYVFGAIAIIIFVIFLIIGFLCRSRRQKVVPPRYAKFGSLSVN